MAHHTVLLALLLAFFATASALDSEGTNFVFAFVRNANAANISNQVLTASVLNQNAQDCMFTLTYRPDYHKATPPQNQTVTVPTMGAIEVVIPNWYGWNYASESVQDDVFLTLMGFSTCPVTVLANNYDIVTGQGDTFMVLPSTWGSKSFTFSLPPAVISTDQQYEQIFVLPTTEGTTRVVVVEIGNAQSYYSFNATYGNAPAVYIGARTPDKRPRTYHVTSDKDVLIVAGVTCAGADASTCDHAAYMPHPPPASDCYAYDYYDDDHVSYLPTTAQFFTDIPGSCLVGQNITSVLNDGVQNQITIKPQMESPLWTIQTTNAKQLGVAFHNGGSNIHIARYYDGTKYNSRGAFIATSPSITQFHADNTMFYTRNANDSLEIYCTILGCAAITIDDVQIKIANTKVTQTVDGVTYYIFVLTIPNAGFHRIGLSSSKGVYSFFVFGKNNQYSYGYVGGVNKPTFVLAPPTTPGPTQYPPTTQTTVTTQSPPTTATPPATQSTASPTTPGTSKQTTTIPSQTTTTGPVVTISSTPAPKTTASASPATTTNPSSSTQSTVSTTIKTSTQAPITSPQTPSTPVTTTATLPVITISSTPAPKTTASPSPATTINRSTQSTVTFKTSTQASPQTTTITSPQTTTTTTPGMTTTTTKLSVTSTVSSHVVTTNSVTSTTAPKTQPTNPPVTTQTTAAPTSATTVTTAPLPSTVTTNTPVVTTTTKIPVVTTQTTLPPQTSSPTTPTTVTASQSTVRSTVTTPTPAPTTGTTTTPTKVVTTTTTTVTVPTTTTTTTPTTPTTTTKSTVPVVTTTVPFTSTPTTPATTKTTKTTATTATTATTQTPSTSTQSSSVVSLALPVFLTILFSIIF